MNYEGKLVNGLTPNMFLPLQIDVEMEYEIDKSMFPGLNDVDKNPPALIYDLTQDDEDDDIISLIGKFYLLCSFLYIYSMFR